MTRFKWMGALAALAVVAVVAGGVVAHAQGPGGRRGGGGPGRGEPRGGFGAGLPLGQLNISDAQRTQIRAIVTRARDEQRPSAERLRQALEARRAAVLAQPVNEGQIRATTQALVTAQTDLAIARAKVRSDILAVLTPEQQAKANELRAQREARMQQREQRRQERRQERNR